MSTVQNNVHRPNLLHNATCQAHVLELRVHFQDRKEYGRGVLVRERPVQGEPAKTNKTLLRSIRKQLQHCKDHGLGVLAIQRQMQVELAISG